MMATKEISVKKYVVRLSSDERERLQAQVGKGKSPACRLLKARILLKADVSDGIIEATPAGSRHARQKGLSTSSVISLQDPNREPSLLLVQ
jgi:hypothetical protein